jgi:GNAT superfamily N-acetyltransferase
MPDNVSHRKQEIADLEWANYAATQSAAQVTPGLELVLREDVILTGSAVLPMPDANHACLVRSTDRAVSGVLDEVITYFQSRDIPPTFYLSPACTPPDLPARLAARGFAKQAKEEAWMVVRDIPNVDLPRSMPNVAVRPIGRDQVATFAKVFLEAFGMPAEFTPPFVQLLEPSVGLENTRHYLAFDGERPVGTCSLLTYGPYGVLGSAGVIRSRRGRGAATNLAVAAVKEARRRGITTVMLQTTAGTLLERLLRIYGFERVFTRTCYGFSDAAH